jgi:hypothetical protein
VEFGILREILAGIEAGFYSIAGSGINKKYHDDMRGSLLITISGINQQYVDCVLKIYCFQG